MAQLHEAATLASGGLDDFGSNDYVPGLEVLLDSLESEAALTVPGAQEIHGVVLGALIGRLTSEAGWKTVPAHTEVPIRQPIFVTGLARSGTTAIHRLLAADPGHQALEMFLGVAPQPRPPREEWTQNPAFTALDARLRTGLQGTAEGRAIHFLSAELPDECHLLTGQSFLANSFPSVAHVPSYVDWLADQDWTGAMQRHRRNLQLIGSTSPEKRWVLKNPGHLRALDGILAAYPDAIVIQMHRDPKQTIASVASVIQYFEGHTSPLQNGAALGRFQLEMFARDAETFLVARERHDPKHIVDIYYPDFVADPVGTVEGFYLDLGLPYNQGVRRALEEEYRVSTTGDRAPRHACSLADFGLTAEEVDERFAVYLDAHPSVVRPRTDWERSNHG